MNLFSLHALKQYIFSVLLSFLTTTVLFGVISIVFSFVTPAPWLFKAISDYSIFFTVLLCSFLSARSSPRHGLLTGVISAVICLVILFFTGYVIFKTNHSANYLLEIFPIGILCGSLGGVLGINSKRS